MSFSIGRYLWPFRPGEHPYCLSLQRRSKPRLGLASPLCTDHILTVRPGYEPDTLAARLADRPGGTMESSEGFVNAAIVEWEHGHLLTLTRWG